MFFFSHFGEFVFEVQFFVEEAAGVEEFFEGLSACFVPVFQFFDGWVVFFDVAVGKFYAVCFKKFFCFLAGCAFRIFDEEDGVFHVCISVFQNGNFF